MLSSKEVHAEFSYQGFDIDSISDITGISMNMGNYAEEGSRRSGSFSSDNTEALLSMSLRDIEGDESLLESVSQVGGDVEHAYVSPKNGTGTRVAGKHEVPSAGYSKVVIGPEGFSEQSGTSEVSYVHNGMLAKGPNKNIQNEARAGIPAQSFEGNEHFDPKAKSSGSNLKKEVSFMTRNFSSDSDVAINGRDSVIKRHSSLPGVKRESTGYANNFDQKHSRFANGDALFGHSHQDLFNPHPFARERPRAEQGLANHEAWEQGGSMRDSSQNTRDINGHYGTIIGKPYIHDHQNMRDFHDHNGTLMDKHGYGEHDVYNENGYFESSAHDGRNEEEMLRSKDHMQERSVGQSLREEMLLGVKHDPETNELYDDKVREGADLLSKVLGGEHNASFTSFSSRSSERNERIKSGSFKEKTSLDKQRSLDSSVQSEPRLPASSSPKREQVLNTQPNADATLEKQMGLQVKPIDELPHSEATDLKQLELDVEEILSRKKIAIHELQMLKESLHRNQADMKSSESLVEQYRCQATQARSELMDLEKRRSQLQEECTALNGALQKAKQKERFNSDEVIFGRSKDEIFRALQERDQLKQDLDSVRETLKREQTKAKLAQSDLRAKIESLETELRKQHEENVKNLQMMKEQVHRERQKVQSVQQDKLNAVNKMHDEMKEQQERENETLKTQMSRERKSHIEILEEKLSRETSQWKRATENGELRIKQLEESLYERNEELNKIRIQLREEKQKNLDIEKQWRSQLESERQDADIKYDGQERTWKDREERLLQQQKEFENLIEERTTDFRRAEERCRSQTEELQKIIENKNEEIKMIRGLVRQQEDATRVLGERLRNEAREHVRNAVEKERQSLQREKERIKRIIDEEREKHDRTVKQVTEELDLEKERHSQTKKSLNKLKQEGEELRKQVVEVHGERITSVQRARQESGEELGKIKEKLHEFSIHAEKMEKIDQETAKAIYEECRKIAEMVDMPLTYKTPSRFSEQQTGGGDGKESPTKEALASLRQCSDELRHRLAEMKKQLAKQSARKDQANESKSNNEMTELRKHLTEKEEEMKRQQRKQNEEIQKLKEEKKKEQLSYRKTISKLEQEFQKLVTAKTSSTPYRTPKRETISRSTVLASNGGTHSHSPAVNPASRPVEKSSSADLLKHLQDRVKKLRAENENLKKSSEKESLEKNGRNPDSALLQSKGLTISQLRTPTKGSVHMSDNIEQVSRIQKLLASSTKDDAAFGQGKPD